MKITRVATALLQGNFEWLLVRVETDAGITGLGEAHWGAGVQDAIRRFAPILVGEDARDIDRLWRKMCLTTSGVPWAGAVLAAANGIETALFDAVGKRYGIPIWQLLGGRYRDRVRIYADCHAGVLDEADSGYTPGGASTTGWHEQYAPRSDYRPAAYAARARWAADQGFTFLKFDLDVPSEHETDPHNRRLTNPHVDYLAAVVEEAIRAVGTDVEVAFDCHWHYNVGDAIRLAKALEPLRPAWLEDPVPPENVQAMAQVAAVTSLPICTGENLYGREPFSRLLAARGADIVEPDFPRSGGFLEFKRICDLADQWYVPVAPHNVGSPIATLAAAHLAAAIPNFLAIEYHAIDVPWWSDLVADGAARIDRGYLRVPERPGLGVELDEDVARAHLKPGEGFFED